MDCSLNFLGPNECSSEAIYFLDKGCPLADSLTPDNVVQMHCTN